ncbi:Hsp20/alpha crystallin family protein [Sediminimonas sp.]|uniref:Hsp20/alpha crystallin family protein n=1 Tax=Sediminimonas sp. TaxID=2823379 RepID=UPI0025CEF4C3|nr:Hsp20/alpha crystallin family protein [Sediminimonas sp.]
MNPMVPRNRFLDEFFGDFPLGYSVKPLHGDPLPAPEKIKIDVKDNAKSFTVHAEMPGLKKDDIHVTVDGNVVTIQAEVKQHDADTEDGKLLHSERYYGSIQRSFTLPAAATESKAKAKYENGILTLNLPKKDPGGSKKITVT